jgi:hypothetical protein
MSHYVDFRNGHNVYNIFRCGLAHEYYVKKSYSIAMLGSNAGPGIGGEIARDASRLLISKLSCSPVGETQIVKVTPGTRAYRAYGKEEIAEEFACSYGLNQAYRDEIEQGELKVAGIGLDGEVRIVEFSNHRFFLATLFVPHLSSSPEMPHPLITEYLKAAMAFQALGVRKGLT